MDALLSEKPFSEISVSDLARRAKIGRQTFYRHFNSIGAMLDLRLTTNFSDQIEWAAARAQDPTPQDWSYELTLFAFEQFEAQPHVARAILSGEAGKTALSSLQKQLEALHNAFAKPEKEIGSPDLQRVLTAFRAGAILGVLLSWVKTDCTPKASEMAHVMSELLREDRIDDIRFPD